MIAAIGDIEARELLRAQRLGRLGCCDDDGVPYVIPVNYLFDSEQIFIHSLPGRKINLMRRHPQVCLQVDDIQDEYNWRSVIATGLFEEVTDPAERDQILRALFRHLPHLTPVEAKMTKGLPETIVFRIRVTRITGLGECWKS